MNRIVKLCTLCAFFFLALSCQDSVDSDPAFSNDTKPDYLTVFPQEKVNTLEIVLGKSTWDKIKADVKTKLNVEFGVPTNFGGGQPPAGGGGQPTLSTADPSYVAATINFNGKTWKNVGFRPKGNSSLLSIWGAGIYKFPFRLKMDEFEDTVPETKNQRFYGFKDLSMSPAFADNSLIREKVGADVFRIGGVAAAQTAFYKVYVDFGEGLKYCGVYTMVEVIDDTMVKTQFGEDKGNIYKPESNFKAFSQAEFEKKNNKTANDYGDVQNFVKALNDPIRNTNADLWRKNLEATIDMDNFLKYLAINNTIVNWDTYGVLAHNHYLYNHSTKKLMWIPWDHNMSLTNNVGLPGVGGVQPPNGGGQPPNGGGQPPNGGGQPPNGAGGFNAVSISMNEVSEDWPLLKFVKEDPVYYAKYKQNIRDFTQNTFTTSKMNDLFDKYTNLIKPYVNGTEVEVKPYSNLNNLADFNAALTDLKNHVNGRIKVANDFTK